VPGRAKVNWNEAPEALIAPPSIPLLPIPLLPIPASPMPLPEPGGGLRSWLAQTAASLVVVCADGPLLVQRTVVPTFTVIVAGA